MNIARIIQLDLARRGAVMQLGEAAVAGDRDSRSLVFALMQEGEPWVMPEGVRAAVAFRTEGGFSGEYDSMPDGTDAFSVEENRVAVRLIDQILAQAGTVRLMLVLRDEKLRQLATFPVLMEVSEGIEGVEPLPRTYYRVRDLDEINEELVRLDELLKLIDTQTNIAASQEARAAAEEAKASAASVNAEQIAAAIARKADDLYVEDGWLYLMAEGEVIGEGIELPRENQGLAFDGGYVDEGNLLHLTLDGADIEGFTPFQIPAGGGGAASILKLTTSLASREFAILDRDDSCVIPYSWTSLDSTDKTPTGSGFAEWTVNGSRVALTAVEQGDNTFDVRKYLSDGAQNTVVLKVTDVYGTFRTMSFTVTVTAYGLSWNLAETGIYGSMGFTVRLTPTGSGEKTVKVAVDDNVVSETTVATTGRTITVTVPKQSYGAHTVKAWMEIPIEGETLTTEPLTHTGVWLSEGVTTPVVAVLTPEVMVGQFGTAPIRWFAVNPTAETTDVTLKVGGETVSVLENVDRSVQIWSYKANTVGSHDLSIHCGSASANVTLSVEGLGYDIAPVTAGLLLDLDPAGHSNSEANRLNFGYTDGSGVNHPLTFSDNFDWVGGGFQTDSEGITAFVVKRGCSVTLDRGLFDSDCRTTGRNIKLIFRSENVRNYDAELMRCKSGNVGMVVNAQKATVTSQLETMSVPYYEGRRIEMDVCIEAETEHSLAWIDLKAIPSCPPVKYGSTDSWGQDIAAPLTIGSDEADVWIYRLKLYGNSLNRYEVLDNFIADCGDPAEMVARYERNDVYNDDGTLSRSKLSARNGGLRVIHLRAGRMTTGKEDEVTADFEMVYGDGGESRHLTAQGVTFKAQGTSSLEYILAALNLDVDFSDAVSFVNGKGDAVTAYAFHDNAIPVSYFNLKANVASSESANNVCLADDYNAFNPYVCAPRAADSRVRDTIEGHPCAVFFTNTSDAAITVGARTVQSGETILYFAGDMNNSKKNFAVFGQDNSKWPKQCCVEVMNNTENPCRFREDISDDETWKDGNFEFRFPKNPTDEMKAAFTAMQRWVVSTTVDLATNEAFAVPVTINGVNYSGDTAEYRKAKFVAEFENWFVKDQMLFHYLFTERHCMTDNRAKNLFMCYEFMEELNDYRWSVRCDYDNDTAEGCDNSGGATFSYGIEDTDIVGSSYAFNAHDSTLWCNIRDLMAEDLTALYISMRGGGAWNAQRIIDKFNAYQDATPEAVRIEDMWNKYFTPWINADAAAYGKKCHGDKEYWREQFERYQQVYMDSKYCDVSDRSNAISMRATIDTASAGNVTLTGYSDMYHTVMYGNGGRVKLRAKRNVPTLIACPTDSLGDTETYIFNASHLTAISSLAALKPKFVLATTASRLQELIVGSGAVGYQNLNLNQLGVGNNQMLELLDLRGCPNLVTALDLSALTSLEEFYAGGSGITGVSFAQGAPLKKATIPAVSSLVARGLSQVEEFLIDGSGLQSLRVEGSPGIDTLAICKAAAGLVRGRLTDVSWTDDNADVLVRLSKCKGLDALGKPTDAFVLTGKAYVSEILSEEIEIIAAAFPELVLTYGTIVEGYTVTFRNYDGTVWEEATQFVRAGGTAVNPVSAGLIGTPVKPSDVEHHYTYAGWDKALAPINANTTITAIYSAADRYYRVTHWLDTSHSVRLQEKSIIAHGSCSYVGSDPAEEDGKMWMGWDTVAGDVVVDMDIHAVFITPRLPDSIPQEYDYLYSDNPNDSSAFALEEFVGVLENGAGKTYFQIGDKIKIVPDTEVFADSEVVLSVHGFNHYPLADGSTGLAGVVFGMVGLMNAGHRMNATNTNEGGWPATEMRTFLNETIFPELPVQWKKLIRQVEVRSSAGGTKADIVTSQDRLFLLSVTEVGLGTSVPYCDEIDPAAEQTTFALYTTASSRLKRRYNGTGSVDYYSLRSPNSANSTSFLGINGSSGGSYEINASTTRGIAWVCCMGGMSV